MVETTRFQIARETLRGFLDRMKAQGLVESFYVADMSETPISAVGEKFYIQAAHFSERYAHRAYKPRGDYTLTFRDYAPKGLSMMFHSVSASATHGAVIDLWTMERPFPGKNRRRGEFEDIFDPAFQTYLDRLETLMTECMPVLKEDAYQQSIKIDMPARRF